MNEHSGKKVPSIKFNQLLELAEKVKQLDPSIDLTNITVNFQMPANETGKNYTGMLFTITQAYITENKKHLVFKTETITD